MRIAVNTRLLIPNKLEGIGRFTHETLSRMTKAHPEHEFLFIFDREYDEQFVYESNVTPEILYPSARHPILYYMWFEWRMPPKLRRLKADLFFSPDGYLSLNSEIKQHAVIHDINFEHYPHHLPIATRKHYRYYFPKFAHKAERLATVSEFSRNDIAGQYQIDSGKIDVVHNGVSDTFHPISEADQKAVRNEYAAGNPYFIYIGALHPRKNMAHMFRAFDAFKSANPGITKLLVVGEKRWWTKPIREAYDSMQHQEDVIFTNRLSNEELNRALASSLALIYVSYFEGFGIPILEAMQCEIPVITSNVTSMPEVAGDAAVYVSPFDIDSIRTGMESIYKDEALRKELIEKGKEQRQLYSWDLTAEKLWASIEKALS